MSTRLTLPVGVLCLAVAGAAMAQEVPAPAASAASAPELDRVVVRGKRLIDIGPLPGLAVTKDQIPANIQSATKEEIKASRSLNIGDYMNTQLQGVSVNDYAGNPFQMDVNYRGFTASPQVGTPQGLSVFFDGVRVNEPFGDVVNWDLIPTNAIERFDLFPGSNPIFGLNTLGGAISVRSKSGFTAPGMEASVLGGSWGRQQLQLSGGAHGEDNGVAGFAALNLFHEDGWRDNSPSNVRQLYLRGDKSFDRAVVTASLLAADNRLVGNGLIPLEIYQARPETVFTSPDEGKSRLTQFALSGTFDVNDTQNITGRLYRRKSDRTGVNGDIYEGFDDLTDSAADPNGVVRGRNGGQGGTSQDPGVVAGTPIGLLSKTSLEQVSTGFGLQYNWNLPKHKFMVGASLDRAYASYSLLQRLALIDASHNVYADPDHIAPVYIAAQRDIPGSEFDGTSTTKSLYFSETWSAQPNLFVTASGRYNHTKTSSDVAIRASSAERDLTDLKTTTDGIDDLINDKTVTNEAFRYTSFNPSLGVNWLPTPGLNLYGNLSRGARTPSVVELGCAFDSTPVDVSFGGVSGTRPRSLLGAGCSLPTTLSGDPYLKQIRSTSGEVGGRGSLSKNWEWSASVYRTDLKDDIYFVGVGDGKSFFDTVGKTRRQGLELGVSGKAGPFTLKANYSYTDATFESTFYTISQHNSSADFDQNSQGFGNQTGVSGGTILVPSPTANANGGRGTYHMIRVDPGARLPGISPHNLNASVSLQATAALKVGMSVVAHSGSYVRANENNAHAPGGSDLETAQYNCNREGCGSGPSADTPVRPGRPFNNPGAVPGFAIFSLDAAFKVTERFSVFAQVTNLFDRQYYTAGRLGVNPFSKGTYGAIGPSGWNYNSAEWQNTTYVGPGSPRGIWVGLSYDLDGPMP